MAIKITEERTVMCVDCDLHFSPSRSNKHCLFHRPKKETERYSSSVLISGVNKDFFLLLQKNDENVFLAIYHFSLNVNFRKLYTHTLGPILTI